MKTLQLAACLLLATGCTAAQFDSVKDAHSKTCDMIGDGQREALEAEAERQGIPFAEIFELFRKSCVVAHKRAGDGAIGVTLGHGDKTGCANE